MIFESNDTLATLKADIFDHLNADTSFWINAELVGGPTGQLISNMIAFHMKSSLNWGLAAALGTVLLFGVLALYWIYNRVIGIDRMRLG